MLNSLLKSIGMPFKIRNFMVDYVDAAGQSFHKPMQTLAAGGIIESDLKIINDIRATLLQEGFRVSGIMEAVGEFEMYQLEEVFNSLNTQKYEIRQLYLDPVLAFGPAAGCPDQ